MICSETSKVSISQSVRRVIQARKIAGLIGEIVFPDGNGIPLQNRETKHITAKFQDRSITSPGDRAAVRSN